MLFRINNMNKSYFLRYLLDPFALLVLNYTPVPEELWFGKTNPWYAEENVKFRFCKILITSVIAIFLRFAFFILVLLLQNNMHGLIYWVMPLFLLAGVGLGIDDWYKVTRKKYFQ